MSDAERQDEQDRELWRRVKKAPPHDAAPAGACIDPLELASYVDGRADQVARDRVEAHLAGCEACLEALADVRELLEAPAMLAPRHVVEQAKALAAPARLDVSARPQPRRLWRAAQWAAAAVAAVAVSYAGFQAGSATWRQQEARSALVAREGSFNLGGDEWVFGADHLLEMVQQQEGSR